MMRRRGDWEGKGKYERYEVQVAVWLLGTDTARYEKPRTSKGNSKRSYLA